MGICCDAKVAQKTNNNRTMQLSNDHPPVPVNLSNEINKSICKIKLLKNEGYKFGTGFFMNAFGYRYLITNYHIISEEIINKNIEIEIEIHNHIKMKLNKLDFNNRHIKYYPKYRDITIIEIKNTDKIFNFIQFLDYDKSFRQKGYQIYLNKYIFTGEYPYGEQASFASGQLKNINCYEFEHNIATFNGSSGCPIILLTYNLNDAYVIGIHKQADYYKNINYGTFIGEIFNETGDLNSINSSNSLSLVNYIIAEIYIRESDINNNIRIINSYEEYCRQYGLNIQEKNEKDIKNCEIRINNKLIPFSYFFNFPSRGLYTIKYSFRNIFTNTSFMFSLCSSLIKLDLSNFNTLNVTDMSCMFLRCISLTNLEISNLNTENVINMSYMFSECYSLKNINVSNFKTQNVINMSNMFSWCKSLTYINLANFDTSRVNNIGFMFVGCKALRRENLITRDSRIINNFGKIK